MRFFLAKYVFGVFLLYVLVVAVNPGFMGTDEYWTGITRYIPAQSSQLTTLVSADDVKSPTQIWPMFIAAQGALRIGIENPFEQYHFVVIVLGLLNFLFVAGSFFALTKSLSDLESRILILLLGFYFAAPFALSRPMFESMAAPWLSWAGFFALRYDRRPTLTSLFLGAAAATVSFLLRPQVGFCSLIFLILPVIHKRWIDLLWVGLFGGFLFFISGLPDFVLRGDWHFSLRALAGYNFEHGHEYGDQPWTFYPLLLLALFWAPLIFHRVSSIWLFDYLKKYRSLLTMGLLFIFLHSLFAQKFERFLIPLLPLILVLLTPWIASLWENGHYKRLGSAILLNMALWGAASFQPAQDNIIKMALYLDKNPQIKSVYRIDQIPEWIPTAFIQNPQFQFLDISKQALEKLKLNCQERIVLPTDLNILAMNKSWTIEAHFTVNWMESIAYRFNPNNNRRRTELTLWQSKECQQN
jgi:hypothetical protein